MIKKNSKSQKLIEHFKKRELRLKKILNLPYQKPISHNRITINRGPIKQENHD